MSNPRNLNNTAWLKLFDKYDILYEIENNGIFRISASQIKEFREPRLMAKFDHMVNLPEVFAKNQLAILPVTRGDYVISHFDAYHKFENLGGTPKRMYLPPYLESISSSGVTSEAVALNCAVAAKIIEDFVQENSLIPTVSGRMGSGSFEFCINNLKNGLRHNINVVGSQIEIDAAYEGMGSLVLFEAKRDLSEDFLVRQLFYPYIVWSKRINKPVRSVFLVYSNGIYHLYEYIFTEQNNYSSIQLLQQKSYIIEDADISLPDIQHILYSTNIRGKPNITFPQADKFERVINLCELLMERHLSRDDITEQYAFNPRQANYYTDAARYIGLVEKLNKNGEVLFRLTDKGRKIMNLPYKQKQLAFCKCILENQTFNLTLRSYFENSGQLDSDEIISIMKGDNLANINSESTYRRRSSTVRSWVLWILSLVDKDHK